MTNVVVSSFHNYVPMYDHKYFNVISDYFFHNFCTVWESEVDKLYILDSNWDWNHPHPKIEVIKTDPNIRYYDAYKKVLPYIEADKILFVDNDTVLVSGWVVDDIFLLLNEYDVVSAFDTCGTYRTDKLNGKNKFCPYLFASKKSILMKYLDVDWGPSMPEHETLGKLTEKMLDDGMVPFEYIEDKDDENMANGWFHVRAGSTIAYLLTTREFGDRKTYDDYLKNQPRSELERHIRWYKRMGGDTSQIEEDLEKIYS